MREIIKNTVSKSNKVEQIRNEYQEGRIYSESIRVTEKESRRNHVLHTINIYQTKSSSFINGPQAQNFISEVIPRIQLWALENKTAIDISNQKLKKVFDKLKVNNKK